jgi:RimJ/RimL family protein N-acetyltransferase
MPTSVMDRPSLSAFLPAYSADLLTDRLLLRPAAVTHAEALHAQFNDWDVVRWLARPSWPQNLQSRADHLRVCEAERQAGTGLLMTILVDGVPAGAVGLHARGTEAHLGYWIGRRYWGRGYVSEAAGAVCDLVFAHTRENAIFSGVFEGNLASMRIQWKLGFVEVGTSVHYSVPRGVDLQHIDTKLTRTARRVVLERPRA